jgi:hypothetical protein
MLSSLVKNKNNTLLFNSLRQMATQSSDKPKRVVVTGAAGNIAYAILFRIASGDFLGKN